MQRREDPALLTGSARFVADIALDVGACTAVFVRSNDPHAELLGVDAADARTQPGVIGVSWAGPGGSGALVQISADTSRVLRVFRVGTTLADSRGVAVTAVAG